MWRSQSLPSGGCWGRLQIEGGAFVGQLPLLSEQLCPSLWIGLFLAATLLPGLCFPQGPFVHLSSMIAAYLGKIRTSVSGEYEVWLRRRGCPPGMGQKPRGSRGPPSGLEGPRESPSGPAGWPRGAAGRVPGALRVTRWFRKRQVQRACLSF